MSVGGMIRSLRGGGGGARMAARYQLIMAVIAPGCDQARLYSAKSAAVNVPGRLDFSSPRTMPLQSPRRALHSGSHGSCMAKTYQLRSVCRGLVKISRRMTCGCGTL